MLNNHTDIINYLIQKYHYQTYLEIGIYRLNDNFNHIQIPHKIGVDPNPGAHASKVMTSDEFFKANQETFDIIFIDGLHQADQCYKDIINSLKVLNEKGMVVVHDCNPKTKKAQMSPAPRRCSCWNGDVWRAWVRLRCERNDLSMFVIDIDQGNGIIKPQSNQIKLKVSEPWTYENFSANRVEWLNLIGIDTFEEWMKSSAT